MIFLDPMMISLQVNEHRVYYQTVEEHLEELGRLDEISDAVRQQMVDTDTIINIHFYPRTPVGFHSIYHYDLDSALDEALGCF